MNDKEKALEFYIKCKNISEKVLNASDPDLAEIYNNLGLLYKDFDEKSKALELWSICTFAILPKI